MPNTSPKKSPSATPVTTPELTPDRPRMSPIKSPAKSPTKTTNSSPKTSAKRPAASPPDSPPRKPLPPKFKIPATTPQQLTWHSKVVDESHPLYYIKVTFDRSDFPHGYLIYDRVPRRLLFKIAPKLPQYLDATNTRVILPANALDEDTVHDVITAIVVSAKEDGFDMHVNKKPINLIKIHAVMVLFGMSKEAEIARKQAWDSMNEFELQPEEVDWIWDTYGVWDMMDSGKSRKTEKDQDGMKANPEVKDPWESFKAGSKQDMESYATYTSPYAAEYIDMMVWQLLNLDALGRLDPVIVNMVLGRCPTLKKILEERKEKIGLQTGYKVPSAVDDELSRSTSTTAPTMLEAPAKEDKAKASDKATGGDPSNELDEAEVTKGEPERTSPKKKPMVLKPHVTPAIEAGLRWQSHDLNLSRASTGLSFDEKDKREERQVSRSVGAVHPWNNKDTDKPSFMKSVHTSMKKDEEPPVNAPTGPKSMFGGPGLKTTSTTNKGGQGVFGTSNPPASAPTGPKAFNNNVTGGGMFGSGNVKTLATPPGLKAFGNDSSIFGGTNTAPATAPTGPKAFGNSASVFGTGNGSSIFGGNAPKPAPFATAPTSNIFGQQTKAPPTIFGGDAPKSSLTSAPTTNIFGQQTKVTPPIFSGFGTSQNGPTGSTTTDFGGGASNFFSSTSTAPNPFAPKSTIAPSQPQNVGFNFRPSTPFQATPPAPNSGLNYNWQQNTGTQDPNAGSSLPNTAPQSFESMPSTAAQSFGVSGSTTAHNTPGQTFNSPFGRAGVLFGAGGAGGPFGAGGSGNGDNMFSFQGNQGPTTGSGPRRMAKPKGRLGKRH